VITTPMAMIVTKPARQHDDRWPSRMIVCWNFGRLGEEVHELKDEQESDDGRARKPNSASMSR